MLFLPFQLACFHEVKFDLKIKGLLIFLMVLLNLVFEGGVEEKHFLKPLFVEPMQSVVNDWIIPNFSERLHTFKSTLVDS